MDVKKKAYKDAAAQARTDDRDWWRGDYFCSLQEKLVGTLYQKKHVLEQRSSYVKMMLMATQTQRTERRTDAALLGANRRGRDRDPRRRRRKRADLPRARAAQPGHRAWGDLLARRPTRSGLLAAAANKVIARVMTDVVSGAEPREAIRAIALGVFDAIDASPWWHPLPAIGAVRGDGNLRRNRREVAGLGVRNDRSSTAPPRS